jgi:hypothetical protein
LLAGSHVSPAWQGWEEQSSPKTPPFDAPGWQVAGLVIGSHKRPASQSEVEIHCAPCGKAANTVEGALTKIKIKNDAAKIPPKITFIKFLFIFDFI